MQSQRPIIAACALLLTGLTVTVEARKGYEIPQARQSDGRLAEVARGLQPGEPFLLRDVQLGQGTPVDIQLTRFEVFSHDAVIVVNNGEETLPIPRTVYMKGGVIGTPDSLAVLMIREDGTVNGFLSDAGRLFNLGQERLRSGEVRPVVQEIDPETSMGALSDRWQCGNDQISEQQVLAKDIATRLDARPIGETTTVYEVQMAVETDFEFFQRFGTAVAATSYIGDLFAGATAIYQRDIQTTFVVNYVSIWSHAADPWDQTSTLCALYQLGNYWETNRTTVVRDLVHFVSAKSMGGGVAWLGTLCSSAFTTGSSCPGLPATAKGGQYGVSADIVGGFNPSNPTPIWDIVVISHEIGHNFDSPHTHCYGNYPTMGTLPVDGCYNQEASADCHGGAATLPAGGGSIMSYCHLLNGGLSNISLYFGRAGFYGTNSERVSARMRAKVESVAASCLTAVGSQAVPRYRLYNQSTLEHLYSTNFVEYGVLGSIGWFQEGVTHKVFANTAPFMGLTPIPNYRLYAPGIAQHHWTTDLNEYNVLATVGWNQEGIDGYLLPSAIPSVTAALYRLAFPTPALHLWTTDVNEYNILATRGWTQEGIVGYVLP